MKDIDSHRLVNAHWSVLAAVLMASVQVTNVCAPQVTSWNQVAWDVNQLARVAVLMEDVFRQMFVNATKVMFYTRMSVWASAGASQLALEDVCMATVQPLTFALVTQDTRRRTKHPIYVTQTVHWDVTMGTVSHLMYATATKVMHCEPMARAVKQYAKCHA